MVVEPPLLLGVEIGGTKLQLAVGRADGQIFHHERRPIRPEAGAEAIRDQIVEACQALRGRLETPPAAIGFGFGGPVDSQMGMTVCSHQVAGWDRFPLADWARQKLEIPLVAVGNDAETAGLGEARFGAGRGFSPLFYVTIGSGIGGGLIVAGEIYRGAGVASAEIGHLWIDGTGKSALLEEIASGWSIGQTASKDHLTRDATAVVQAAERGDFDALATLRRATDALGTGLAHVVTLLSPRRIILGGGVSLMPSALWLDPIRARVAARVFPPLRDSFDIVTAELGEEVVLHGALALARDRWAMPELEAG